MIWRHGHEMGVAFPQAVPGASLRPRSADLAERVTGSRPRSPPSSALLKKLKADTDADPA